MTHSTKALTWVAVGSLVLSAVAAKVDPEDESAAPVQSDNPYQAIVVRNVFRLKDPPPPPDPEAVKPPAPKITLTGISTILGKKLAFMKTPPAPVKPGEASKGDQYFTIAEGVTDGPLEVLEINERDGLVKIKYDGQPSTLDFTNNGAKPMAGPVPGVMPAGMPPGGIPAPPATGVQPAFRGVPNQPGALTPMPTRTLRLPTPGGGTTVNPTSSSYQGGGVASPAYTAVQGQAVLGTATAGTAASTQTQTASQPNMPIEHQYIMMEAERERTRDAVVSGIMPPLPPTPLTPAGSPGTQTTPVQQTPAQTVPALPMPRRPGMPLPQ